MDHWQFHEEQEVRLILNVAWAAHRGAAADTWQKAEEIIRQFLPPGSFRIAEEQPDIILFMSGGSERKAISLIQPGQPVLLLSIRGNNAYAAATEVMAWLVNRNMFAILSDATDAFEKGLIERWRQIVFTWRGLHGRRAGLIGAVSDWLVASDVPAEKLKAVFGVTLMKLPWDTLDDFSVHDPDSSLMSRFSGRDAEGLDDAARVLSLLRRVIAINRLNAIGIECFSLVQERKVTACLALAQLNAEGVVAACEGDLASMAGMMLLRGITGSVPWMANTTRIRDNFVLLSHCTIGFNITLSTKLATHYETDCSLAVKGMIPASEVTLFRMSEMLDRAFIAEGRLVSQPDLADACRTQAEIEIPPQSLDLLRTLPLGNHLLMAPGRHAGSLRLACMYKGIKVID